MSGEPLRAGALVVIEVAAEHGDDFWGLELLHRLDIAGDDHDVCEGSGRRSADDLKQSSPVNESALGSTGRRTQTWPGFVWRMRVERSHSTFRFMVELSCTETLAVASLLFE